MVRADRKVPYAARLRDGSPPCYVRSGQFRDDASGRLEESLDSRAHTARAKQVWAVGLGSVPLGATSSRARMTLLEARITFCRSARHSVPAREKQSGLRL
jgi:hypothetical protein